MESRASARDTSSGQDRPPGRPADPVDAATSTRRTGETALPPPGRSGGQPLTGRGPEPAPRLSPLDALTVARSRAEPADPGTAEGYAELDVAFDAGAGAYWCYMNPPGEPTFTPGLVADLARMQGALGALLRRSEAGERAMRYYVLGSRTPRVFSLGNERSLIASAVRRRDETALRDYARACVDVLHTNAVGFDAPVVTVALVEGDAFGFGFETALSCDVVVAERNARFGFPEVQFNLFPGMGAYSFLSRRIGGFRAEEMIVSGQFYTAEELHALGLVQVLAEPGRGREAVEDFIERSHRRHNAQSAVFRVGREVDPISRDELLRVADLWVEAALGMSESDLRSMESGAASRSGDAAAAG